MTDDILPLIAMDRLHACELGHALGDSFSRFGFAMVTGHGIPDDLVADGWAVTRALFALPEAEKRRYFDPLGKGQRGYTPFGREGAKGAQARDLKEFWHVGRQVGKDNPYPGELLPNIWPDALPEFRRVMLDLFDAFDAAGQRLLGAIALYLGLESDWFAGPTRNGNSILRLLHYPPVEGETAGAVRASAHEDINLITLLLGAEEAGLQLLTRGGQWLPVAPPPGALVVNVGDMLQRLTNHRLPSTTHRVVNPPALRAGYSRYSMPFFLHLRPDFLIDALPGCTDSAHPRRDPPITARDYLHERLSEIGLG